MGDAKKKAAGFWEEINKLLKNLFVAFLLFVLTIFVFGELYAIYLISSGNAMMLWLPVFLLMAALFYKVLQ